MTQQELFHLVGSVKDPHLPFGLAELGMLERAIVTESGAIDIVVNVPCHHCPGFQILQDDIETALRAAGIEQELSISFQGSESWQPADMPTETRAALRAIGIQINSPSSDTEGAAA